jgi:hypothetical protein
MEEENDKRKQLTLRDLHRIGLIAAVALMIFMLYYQIVFG